MAYGLLIAAALLAQAAPGVPTENGTWEAPFQHDTAGFFPPPARFEAVHMALVPVGLHRGHVLVWDVQGPQAQAAWDQRWAIVDASEPRAPCFWNAELTLPAGGGDLFCAGHAWTSSGELLVAGGTTRYPNGSQHGTGIRGGRLVYLWDPLAGAHGAWRRQPDLCVDRWYPTVVPIDTGELLIAGGVAEVGRPAFNDYEVFAPRPGVNGRTRLAAAGRFPGPPLPAAELGEYPRLLQLESGEQFIAGMGGASAKMNHGLAPGQWTYTDSSAWLVRDNGMALLAPRRPGAPESVWALGGEAFDALGTSLGVLDSVEACVPGAAGSPAWDWTALPAMREARKSANAVLLPDGGVLVIGGRTNTGFPETAATVPELFAGRRWRQMSAAGSPRSYHSTAVLLPSGKVLTAGGDTSSRDYQVFVPPYVASPARPRILSAPAALPYSSVNPVVLTAGFAPLPSGEVVGRVVLMAPGSVTHSFDASQRYVELPLVSVTATTVSFRGPSHAALAPAGHYMLFLVTASGIPSVASWVLVG